MSSVNAQSNLFTQPVAVGYLPIGAAAGSKAQLCKGATCVKLGGGNGFWTVFLDDPCPTDQRIVLAYAAQHVGLAVLYGVRYLNIDEQSFSLDNIKSDGTSTDETMFFRVDRLIVEGI